MKLTIRLFGKGEICLDGEPIALPTRQTESLLYLLAANAGRGFTRQGLSGMFWPDADPARAGQSLRTALSRIRRALPSLTLDTDRCDVILVPESVWIDIAEAERLMRRSRLAQQSEEEVEAIRGALALVERNLLEDWGDDWAIELRRTWAVRRVELSLRLASFHLDAERHELAHEIAARILTEDPFNEEAWALRLRAAAALKLERAALESFRSARANLRSELGMEFSAELIDLGRLVRTGKLDEGSAAPTLNVAERDLMVRVVESQLATEPESVLPLLSAEPFRRHAFQYPLEAWTLLVRAIRATSGVTESRARAMSLAIRLAEIVDEFDTAFEFGEWVIENVPEDWKEHRYVSNMLGYMWFQRRDWNRALAFVDRFRDLAMDHGNAVEVSIAEMQRATIEWHQGSFQAARSRLIGHYHAVLNDMSSQGRANAAGVLTSVAGIELVEQNWDEAMRYADRAYSIAVTNKIDHLRCSTASILGVAKVVRGDEGGRLLLAQSFAQSYRSRYRRLNLGIADRVGTALMRIGCHGQGRALLDAFGEFRQAICHGRSPAEEMFVSRTIRGMPTSPDRRWAAFTRPSEFIAASCEILDPM